MGKQGAWLSEKSYVACSGGAKNHSCTYGCTACGSCAAVCPNGAIAVKDCGVAQTDERLCVGCGQCVQVCPQGLIHLHTVGVPFVVRCSNKDQGAQAKKACDVSCIACGLCEKSCPSDAVRVVGNAAQIEQELCLSCGNCVVKCPRNVIYDVRGIIR